MPTLTFMATLESVTCGNCGVQFAMPATLLRNLRETGETFYCPSGHRNVFSETTAMKLQKELARERARLDQARAALNDKQSQCEKLHRRLTATQGVVTRTKNRVSKGVCPCCKRYFRELHRHMRDEHPGYANEETTA